MNHQRSTFTSAVDGIPLAVHVWDAVDQPRGVVQVAHGLGEHAGRYDRLAVALNAAGYLVGAIDHRGHGRSIIETPGDFGAPGFDGLIADLAAYGAQLRLEHPDLPLFLVAHSMGSIAAQAALLEHSEQYDGVVLSASTAVDVLEAALAGVEDGAKDQAPAGLEAFNVGFEHRTGYEWLSRDEAEVDAYVADPLCGFDLPEGTLPALLAPGERLADAGALTGIRFDLPFLIISGSDDPLAGGGDLVHLLGSRYRDAGIVDVTATVYAGARHEIFNETNRDEVTRHVLTWLAQRTRRG